MIPEDCNRRPVNQNLLLRFFSKIVIDPLVTFQGTPCWIWSAYKDKLGYGCFRRDGVRASRIFLAHVVAYEMFVSVLSSDLEIDHLCRRSSCCNPIHLEAVTHQVNVLRGIGPTAINAKKTHCHKGHEFTPENTYYAKHRTERKCRACWNAKQRAREARMPRDHPRFVKRRARCKAWYEKQKMKRALHS